MLTEPDCVSAAGLERVLVAARTVAGLLLIAAGTCLLLGSLQGTLIYPPEPVFEISSRLFLWIIGGVAMVLGLLCLFSKSGFVAAGLVAWFTFTLLLYRISMMVLGAKSAQPYLAITASDFGMSPLGLEMLLATVFVCAGVWSWARVFGCLGLRGDPIEMRRPCVSRQPGPTGRTSKFLLSYILILQAAAFSWLPAWAQELSVEGTLDVTTGNAGGIEKISRHEFKVMVVAAQYKLSIWKSGEPQNYHEYSYSNRVMHILHHLGSTARPVPGPFPAIVEFREVPPNDGSRAVFVWFAYCSSGYLKELTNSFALPIWSPEDPELRRQPFSMLTLFTLSDSAPHVPVTAAFINDGYYRSYNPAAKRFDVMKLASPYDRGFTNAVYNVIEFTNWGTVQLPASFLFDVYSSPTSVGESPFRRISAHGRAVRVSGAPLGGTAPPEFTGSAAVADFRQPAPDVVQGHRIKRPYTSYSITNSEWLETTQLEKLAQKKELSVQKRVQFPETVGERPFWGARAAILFLMVLSLCSVAFFIWRTNVRQMSNGKQ